MEVTKKSRLTLRLQNLAFVALFLGAVGLLAWLSTRYQFQADWTAGGRNTLSEASRELLETLEGPVEMTAFATANDVLRKQIEELIGRYRRHKPDLALAFVNPEEEPERTRELGITIDGELLIRYQGREERADRLSEQAITNALQRVARGGERWVVFIEGHGERNPFGQANHDLGNFVEELKRKGFNVQALNLAKEAAIPGNTAALVLAGPRSELLPGELRLVEEYLRGGGNLLWLGDPGELNESTQALADRFGITFLPGVVVDATGQMFGIDNPSFALVADYPPNPVSGDFGLMTLYPQAAALEYEEGEWQVEPLLQTLARSWTETGELSGSIRFDADTEERPGPLTLGLLLTREPEAAAGEGAPAGEPRPEEDGAVRQQRVMVIGDGDFLSNAYLGNGGNLDLGLAMFQWLGHDDRFIRIGAKTAPDTRLNLSQGAMYAIGGGFLILLPLGLVGTGVVIWLRRRRR